MTATWEDLEPVALPVTERLRSLLGQITTIPAFSPLVPQEYQAGYRAGRSDIEPMVDVEVTSLLGVYEVLEVVQALFEPNELGRFLASPVESLGNRTPLETIAQGDANRILELLAAEFEGQVK